MGLEVAQTKLHDKLLRVLESDEVMLKNVFCELYHTEPVE